MPSADFTEIEMAVLEAAKLGDATSANVGSRRVRARTITRLQAMGLLYSANIDGRVELSPKGEAVLAQVSA